MIVCALGARFSGVSRVPKAQTILTVPDFARTCGPPNQDHWGTAYTENGADWLPNDLYGHSSRCRPKGPPFRPKVRGSQAAKCGRLTPP
jgi:hypothetical protein